MFRASILMPGLIARNCRNVKTIKYSRTMSLGDPKSVSAAGSSPSKNSSPVSTIENDITRNVGLSNYVHKTYKKVCIGSLASLGTLAAAPHFEIFTNHPLHFALGGLATSIGSIVAMNMYKPEVISKNGHLVDKPHKYQKAGYWGLVASMTVSCAPFASMIYEIAPTALPAAAVVTTCVMSGVSLYESK